MPLPGRTEGPVSGADRLRSGTSLRPGDPSFLVNLNPVEWTQVTTREIAKPAVRSRPNTARQQELCPETAGGNALPEMEDSPGFPDQSGLLAIRRRPKPGSLPRRAATQSGKQHLSLYHRSHRMHRAEVVESGRPIVARTGTRTTTRPPSRSANRRWTP